MLVYGAIKWTLHLLLMIVDYRLSTIILFHIWIQRSVNVRFREFVSTFWKFLSIVVQCSIHYHHICIILGTRLLVLLSPRLIFIWFDSTFKELCNDIKIYELTNIALSPILKSGNTSLNFFTISWQLFLRNMNKTKCGIVNQLENSNRLV